MALTSLGTGIIDFDTRATVQLPSFQGRERRGYLCFVRAVPITTTISRGYVNLIPLLQTSYGSVEFPLEAKFFPKGNLMAFSIAVPQADWDRDIDIGLLALPREFYRASSEVRQFTLEWLYEDGEDYEVDAIGW